MRPSTSRRQVVSSIRVADLNSRFCFRYDEIHFYVLVVEVELGTRISYINE